MPLPIQLISTDFDGTFFAEFERPPVPAPLQGLIGSLQQQGVKWVINTGRDLSSLLETMGRAQVTIHPDFLVVVEREIYVRDGHRYVPLQPWNERCAALNGELFRRVRQDIGRITEWVNSRISATLYEDAYSPFCMIAESQQDADLVTEWLTEYAAGVPDLTVVRNDVYLRFCHGAYNKGAALAELGRQTGVGADATFAAGDHWNDLPMLRKEFAHFLTAPSNAVPEVKELVASQGGYVSGQAYGNGVARGLEQFLEGSGALASGRMG